MPAGQFVEIGGITIALRAADDRVRWQWRGATSRFVVAERDAEVDISVGVLDAPVSERGELLFDSGAVWRMFRDGDGFLIECRSAAFGPEPYKIARFDASFTRGSILIAPSILRLELNPLDYPLDEVLIANLLGRGRGVELHSCGIVDHAGRGHLFCGVSGAGKSTTARLWEAHCAGIVSDDRVIVRDDDGGGLAIHGTPWHGEAELSMAAKAPLAGVYLLVQSTTNELRELSRADAIAKLFRCAFPPFHDDAAVGFTLQMLERIVDRVPVRELHFTREPGSVELILGGAA